VQERLRALLVQQASQAVRDMRMMQPEIQDIIMQLVRRCTERSVCNRATDSIEHASNRRAASRSSYRHSTTLHSMCTIPSNRSSSTMIRCVPWMPRVNHTALTLWQQLASSGITSRDYVLDIVIDPRAIGRRAQSSHDVAPVFVQMKELYRVVQNRYLPLSKRWHDLLIRVGPRNRVVGSREANGKRRRVEVG